MTSDMWDARYAEKDLVWSGEPNMFLPPIVEPLEVGTALDLACGEGRNALWLAEAGWDVTGVDFSPVAIEKARLLTGERAVEWQVDDVTSYDGGRTFDLVMIVYVHLDASDMVRLFARAVEALSPGGTLIGVGHALRNLTDGIGGPPYPEILWTEDRIAPLVEGLDIVTLGEVLRPVEDDAGRALGDAIDILLHATKPV